MITQTGYPKVLLLGRTNVGKSTLFNRLSSREKSIVFDLDGVTRDYIHEVVVWKDKSFDLIDTGGFPLRATQEKPIIACVQEYLFKLIEAAEILIFVCDIKNGMTEQDRRIAKALHKSKKKLFLVLNKADNDSFAERALEFRALGIAQTFLVSASHGQGIANLLGAIADNLPQTKIAPEETTYEVVIIGKPNVGKSSLLNQLLKNDRAIVSNVAGTTREPIAETIRIHHEAVQLTDTPGIRRKSSVDGHDLEELMVKAAFKSVKDADIVVLVIDASEGTISDQELKLLFFAFDQHKAILVLFNKVDLVTEDSKASMKRVLDQYAFIFDKLPCMEISCKDGKNIGNVVQQINALWKRCQQNINSSEVDEKIKETLLHKPLYKGGALLRLFKIRTVKARVPTFIMHVNNPRGFGKSELAFIENSLRGYYNLSGCPVKLVLKTV